MSYLTLAAAPIAVARLLAFWKYDAGSWSKCATWLESQPPQQDVAPLSGSPEVLNQVWSGFLPPSVFLVFDIPSPVSSWQAANSLLAPDVLLSCAPLGSAGRILPPCMAVTTPPIPAP